jgi:cytoskeletal protein RodZ
MRQKNLAQKLMYREHFFKGTLMSVLEIILWITGAFAAVVALGKMAHEKKCKEKKVSPACKQPLSSLKEESRKTCTPNPEKKESGHGGN